MSVYDPRQENINLHCGVADNSTYRMCQCDIIYYYYYYYRSKVLQHRIYRDSVRIRNNERRMLMEYTQGLWVS